MTENEVVPTVDTFGLAEQGKVRLGYNEEESAGTNVTGTAAADRVVTWPVVMLSSLNYNFFATKGRGLRLRWGFGGDS